LTALILALALLPIRVARASVYTVTNTNNSGAGSLRQAILDANAHDGYDTINFDIPPAMCFDGVCTIYPLTALPEITGNGTTIDGYTQDGASEATATLPADIAIQIDGRNLTECDDPGDSCYGLGISSSSNDIRGLAINYFAWDGIAIGGSGAAGNVIAGNYLGVGTTGVVAPGNGLDGIFIGLGASANTVGGNLPADRNVISGNGWAGVAIHGGETVGNTVSGNYIGTDHTGVTDLGNALDGVWIYGGADYNLVGGASAGERNVIGGNDRDGVRVANATGNVISGNHIGLQPSGAAARGNAEYGVHILNGAQGNTVGGDVAEERNLIAANESGVMIEGANTTNNTVSANYIGLATGGFSPIPNLEDGVRLEAGAHNNTIGGDVAGERNIISANGQDGVVIDGAGTNANTVSGNYIGTEALGVSAVGNTLHGVVISGGAQNNTVGGDTAAKRNIISGNHDSGVGIWGNTTTGNVVAGNYIGLNASGLAALGNDDSGVLIGAEAHGNTIGGDTAGERNVISGNGSGELGRGISLVSAYSNIISGNYIGTDASGSVALGNTRYGVEIAAGEGNTIGGNTEGERNVISGNGYYGIHLTGPNTGENVFSGNYIGVDATGTLPLANFYHGLIIVDGAHDNTIGGGLPGERNVISSHGNYGVGIWGDGADGNLLIDNYIGTDAGGSGDLGNGGFGVYIGDAASGNWVQGGIVAHNSQDGVHIDGGTTLPNFVCWSSLFDNGWVGINLNAGANGGILPPAITSAEVEVGGAVIRGTACANCFVELFASHNSEGEGEYYLGFVRATAAGQFAFTATALPYPYLTATARDLAHGTSEFSSVLESDLHVYHLPLVLR
jgi:titin